MDKPTLAQRCRIHADNMQSEGWYTTANVLAEAADKLELMEKREAQIDKEYQRLNPEETLEHMTVRLTGKTP